MTVLSPSLAGIAPVLSGLDVSKYLVKSWGTGNVAPDNGVDPVGAFRMLCTPTHNAYVDPIVYPGSLTRSHLHTFFGNTAVDENSTYASLRTTGESSCNNLLNRSAYWVPSLMNGRGKVVMPNALAVYYKRIPASHPGCTTVAKACLPLPRGLRYVFGYNMNDPAKSSPAHTYWWTCDGPGASGEHSRTIARAAKTCAPGSRLGLNLVAANCWNGTELDTPDHRSHMSYPVYGNDGVGRCPATHPYLLPEFTLGAWYTVDATLDRSGNESPDAVTWYLSSDRMAGMANMVPGTSAHADWFGAWEDSILAAWQANCIDKHLNCNSGDLGDGRQLAMTAGYDYTNTTVLVDPPARP